MITRNTLGTSMLRNSFMRNTSKSFFSNTIKGPGIRSKLFAGMGLIGATGLTFLMYKGARMESLARAHPENRI